MKASPAFKALCEEWLKELHRAAYVVVASGEQHAPMIVAFMPDGRQVPLLIPELDDDDDKRTAAALHRRLSAEQPACMVLEAWAGPSCATKDEAERMLDEFGAVRNMPTKRECIVFNFMLGQMQLLATAFIERRDDDDDILEPPLKYTDTALVDPFVEGSSGNFVLNQREGSLQ